MTSRCIYHPNPMTKRLLPPTPAETPKMSVARDTRTSHGENMGSFSHGFHQDASDHSGAQSSLSPSLHDTVAVDEGISSTLRTNSLCDRPWERGAQYLGPTSSSSVFIDNDLLDNSTPLGKHPSSVPFDQPLLGRDRPSEPTVRMNYILKALWSSKSS
jgi:hypothetical protein